MKKVFIQGDGEDGKEFYPAPEVEAAVLDIKKAVRKCFGRRPLGCDGTLLVGMENYNALVEILNSIVILEEK